MVWVSKWRTNSLLAKIMSIYLTLSDTLVAFFNLSLFVQSPDIMLSFQSEFLLMHGIIPEKNQREVFDKLIQSSLELVIREGEQIAHTAKKYISKHDYSAVYSIFPVTRHLRNIKPEFDKTLEVSHMALDLTKYTLLTTGNRDRHRCSIQY